MKIVNTNKLNKAYRRDSKKRKNYRIKISDNVSVEDIIKDNRKRKLRKKRKERIKIKEEFNES